MYNRYNNSLRLDYSGLLIIRLKAYCEPAYQARIVGIFIRIFTVTNKLHGHNFMSLYNKCYSTFVKASIGADFGAVIPEGATIEIIESKTSSENTDAYQKMATWIDKQISKLVLGQTMTTDDGSSRAQGEIHEEVRQDIAQSGRAALFPRNTIIGASKTKL